MLITGEIYQLINFASFARWFFIALATLGMLIHRYRFPLHPRPFKVRNCYLVASHDEPEQRFSPAVNPKVPLVVALVFTVVCFFIVCLSLYSDPWNTGRSCLLTLTGLPVYYATVHRFRLPHKWRRTFSKSQSSHPSVTSGPTLAS